MVQEELKPVVHVLSRALGCERLKGSQLKANPSALISKNDNARVMAACKTPFRVQPAEVRSVLCVEDAPFVGGKGQVRGVGITPLPGFVCCQTIEPGASKCSNKRPLLRILVEIEAEDLSRFPVTR